jgi:hypothetical protein
VTKADKARLDAIHKLPCVACGRRPAEAHHIVDKGYRRLSGGHSATIPLCDWCHRGVPIWQASVTDTAEFIGPSLALHKRDFVAKYGTERDLLAKTDAALGKEILPW